MILLITFGDNGRKETSCRSHVASNGVEYQRQRQARKLCAQVATFGSADCVKHRMIRWTDAFPAIFSQGLLVARPSVVRKASLRLSCAAGSILK
jgi:hypothetical protein